MPPSNHTDDPGWILSDQLILPPQTLLPEEIEPFLEFLFSGVVCKPKRLKLRETAGVARYLKAVAREAPASQERRSVEHLAEVIWLTMLDCGQIAIAGKEEAIQFLNEHAHTYFASFDIDGMVEFVRKRKEPASHAEFFRPPKLLGEGRSVSGQGPARLQDDLTERIYVAYHALRRARIRNARGRIAAVLNRVGLETHPRSATVATWSSGEVNERVQQFEARMVRLHRLSNRADRTKQIERLRNMRVDGWIYDFHFTSAVESASRPNGARN